MNTITENISRTRSRIVQSPERIKRDIHNMGNSAAEEKRTVAANEAKTRDLQTKITALLNIEKDVRSCVEQLQTIEKEMRALDGAQKELGDLRDSLDRKKGERAELVMRREVGDPLWPPLSYSGVNGCHLRYSVFTSSFRTRKRSLNVPSDTLRTSASLVSRRSSDCSASMRRWRLSGGTMTGRWKSCVRKQTTSSAR